MRTDWMYAATSAALGFLTTAQAFSAYTMPCNTESFTLAAIKGMHVNSIQVQEQNNYTFQLSIGPPITGLDFCNITVTYTHPGWNDEIIVTTFLPLKGRWNGRFLGNGGAGYVTGGKEFLEYSMMPGLNSGFAVSTTNGGHSESLQQNGEYTSSWALTSVGNVNWPLLVDFAYVALHDMATIGKALTETFYQAPANYSYFCGASTGGRQGHMFAQRYPKDFDGIVAVIPAINFTKFLFANLYPAFIMNLLGVFPRACELDAMRDAAITACDPLDGLQDGVISRPDLCHFDPHTLVGQKFDCDGAEAVFSEKSADVAAAAWNGPRSETGTFQWYGFGYDSKLTQPGIGPAVTTCDTNGICKDSPFAIPDVWARYFVLKDPDFNLRTITHRQWDEIFHASTSEYESIIGTTDADLSQFKGSGGKMINWHGMADQAIPFNGSVHYYDKVLKEDPEVKGYYRLFLVPGADHTYGMGVIPSQSYMMQAIVDWVEKGIAPERLRGSGLDGFGKQSTRDLCMYPRVQHYIGGDSTTPEAFTCT